jgi:hypothetical protein
MESDWCLINFGLLDANFKDIDKIEVNEKNLNSERLIYFFFRLSSSNCFKVPSLQDLLQELILKIEIIKHQHHGGKKCSTNTL